jgi:hypothetical protein
MQIVSKLTFALAALYAGPAYAGCAQWDASGSALTLNQSSGHSLAFDVQQSGEDLSGRAQYTTYENPTFLGIELVGDRKTSIGYVEGTLTGNHAQFQVRWGNTIGVYSVEIDEDGRFTGETYDFQSPGKRARVLGFGKLRCTQDEAAPPPPHVVRKLGKGTPKPNPSPVIGRTEPLNLGRLPIAIGRPDYLSIGSRPVVIVETDSRSLGSPPTSVLNPDPAGLVDRNETATPTASESAPQIYWSIPARLSIRQAGCAGPIDIIGLSQDGGNLGNGSAHSLCSGGPGVPGRVTGTFRGNSVKLRIDWGTVERSFPLPSVRSVGVYEGVINSQGYLEGSTYDAANPEGERREWRSVEALTRTEQ